MSNSLGEFALAHGADLLIALLSGNPQLSLASDSGPIPLSIAQAAADLGVSSRTVNRLTRRLRVGGAGAFRSVRAGKPPNNAFDPAIRDLVLERARTTYVGFGPTSRCTPPSRASHFSRKDGWLMQVG